MTTDRRCITAEQANAAYDILVREAGARESRRLAFVEYMTDSRGYPHEFRFMGTLGGGGKCWLYDWPKLRLSVTCYSEDETPERRATIERVNALLEEVL